MHPCPKCGNLNGPETNFCRSCGTKVIQQQAITTNPYDYGAPSPYSWKTDEFRTDNDARSTGPVGSAYPVAPIAPNPYAGPIAPRPQFAFDANYRCFRCGSSYLPLIERRVSTAGWVVFSVLLVTTLIFFWVGLLLKEDVAVCPVCRTKVG